MEAATAADLYTYKVEEAAKYIWKEVVPALKTLYTKGVSYEEFAKRAFSMLSTKGSVDHITPSFWPKRSAIRTAWLTLARESAQVEELPNTADYWKQARDLALALARALDELMGVYPASSTIETTTQESNQMNNVPLQMSPTIFGTIETTTQESNQMNNVPFQMIPTVFGKNAEQCSEQDLIDAAKKCDECIKAISSLQGSSTKIDAKIESYKEQKAAILRILDARP